MNRFSAADDLGGEAVETLIYRRVALRSWEQGTFSELSPLPPSGQSLSLVLNLSRLSTIIPGVSNAGRGACLDLLRNWSSEDVDRCLNELRAHGALVDLSKALVFQPWVLDEAAPESPNVVRAWRKRWRELPACEVKSAIDLRVRQLLTAHCVSKRTAAAPWIRAWDPTYAEPSAKVDASLAAFFPEALSHPSRKGVANLAAPVPESGNSNQGLGNSERETEIRTQHSGFSEQDSGGGKGKSVEKGKPSRRSLTLSAPFECTCGALINQDATGTRWNADGGEHQHSAVSVGRSREGGGRYEDQR